MVLKEWIEFIGIIIGAIGVVIVLPWWLRGKFSSLENRLNTRLNTLTTRLNTLTKSLVIVSNTVKSIFKIQETTITILTKAGHIPPSEQIELYRNYGDAYKDILDKAMDWTTESNPLTSEEKRRLREYKDMILKGERFSLDQAKEFHHLVHKLEEEEKVDPAAVGILVGLSAFILGGALGSSTE